MNDDFLCLACANRGCDICRPPVRRRTLLGLSDELLDLYDLIDSGDGEVSPELEERLDALQHDFSAKLDAYASLAREADLEASALEAEVRRLEKRIRRRRTLIANLKARVQLALEAQGQKRFRTGRFTLSLCANGGGLPVEIVGKVEELPPAYLKVTVEPDKDALRQALSRGEAIPGARLGERGHHVRIQ